MYSCISIIYFVPTMSRYFYWFIKGDNNFTQIIRTVHEFHHILLKIKVPEDTITLGTTERRICFSNRLTISWLYFAHNECFRRMLMHIFLKPFDDRWIECDVFIHHQMLSIDHNSFFREKTVCKVDIILPMTFPTFIFIKAQYECPQVANQ